MGYKTIHKITLPLANSVVAAQGAVACIDRATGSTKGKAVVAAVDTHLIPVGRFCSDLTGDGSTTIDIELFEPKRIQWLLNDAADTLTASDVGGLCYFASGGTVSVPADPSTYSVAGRVWIVEGAAGARIGIEIADKAAPSE